jgi:hypothetical protein
VIDLFLAHPLQRLEHRVVEVDRDQVAGHDPHAPPAVVEHRVGAVP